MCTCVALSLSFSLSLFPLFFCWFFVWFGFGCFLFPSFDGSETLMSGTGSLPFPRSDPFHMSEQCVCVCVSVHVGMGVGGGG